VKWGRESEEVSQIVDSPNMKLDLDISTASSSNLFYSFESLPDARQDHLVVNSYTGRRKNTIEVYTRKIQDKNTGYEQQMKQGCIWEGGRIAPHTAATTTTFRLAGRQNVDFWQPRPGQKDYMTLFDEERKS